MAWYKVDDGFYSHHKVLLIPRGKRAEAAGTWTLCGTWAADKRKDGKIPSFMVEELGGTLAGAASLVDVKLWRETKSGYVFVNWSEFQPTRAQIDEQTQKERERKAAYRAKAQGNTGEEDGDVPSGQTRIPTTPTRPVPKRPKTLPVYSAEFEEFWNVYPRKEAKADAFKAYLEAPGDPADILKGAQAYALMSIGRERTYLKLGGGWLRELRWTDEHSAEPATKSGTITPATCIHGYPTGECEYCLEDGAQF